MLLGAPTLRLRGDYLAIVTLGFGEIVPVVFLNSDTYTNGTNGITGLAQPDLYGRPRASTSFGFTDPCPYYITVVVHHHRRVILLYRLQDSRLGRAWMAIREDELAAASMGINTVTTKLLAFAIGASTSGLAGVFYAAKLAMRQPGPVRLHRVVHGPGDGRARRHGQHLGRGRRRLHHLRDPEPGPQAAERLHARVCTCRSSAPIDLSSINFLNYQYLLYGIALVGMMLLRPEGLFPSRRRRRELHEAADPDADGPRPCEELSEA